MWNNLHTNDDFMTQLTRLSTATPGSLQVPVGGTLDQGPGTRVQGPPPPPWTLASDAGDSDVITGCRALW